MPNRIIKESICTSENIDMLTPFQETVFVRLMVNCDDYGRFDGRAKVLSSRLFPLKDISSDEINDALDAMQKADLITLYTVDGRQYVQMKTWGKHQQTRATKSKYPSPDDADINQPISSDINCNQMIANDSKCPRNRNRESLFDNRESVSLIGDDAAADIQNDHNKILDAAQNAGFKSSPAERAGLLNLYAAHGLEKMLNGISECVKHSAPNLAYLEAVLKGTGKKQNGNATDVHGYQQRDYSGAQAEAIKRMMESDW